MEPNAPDRPGAPPAGRHPDDLPPAPARPGLPRGAVWALVLALVVLTVAGWRALSSTPAGSPGDDGVVHLGGRGGASGLPPTLPDVASAADVVGKPAPAVAWTGLAGGDGSLAALRGRPVVLNFWASWCVPCLQEMPAYEQVHRELGDRVAFVGIDVTDTEDAGRLFAERTGVSYPLGRDPDGRLLSTMGGVNLPTTVLIGADGTVVDVLRQQQSADELRAAVQERLLR